MAVLSTLSIDLSAYQATVSDCFSLTVYNIIYSRYAQEPKINVKSNKIAE